jgi:hypothetical protein
MTVPTSVLRTFETIPEGILKSSGTSSINGLLAIELALDLIHSNNPWPAVLPTEKDFKERMPLMWPPELQMLLPVASSILLNKQKHKLALDWDAASSGFPHLSYDHYIYCWFLVSTRTFYYTSSTPDTQNPPDSNDCLALVPFADYFNHADVGCGVIFSPSEYIFRADRQYVKGEEIFMSYGNHNNDFLLVEYGFTLDENKWDTVPLDEVILPFLSKDQKEILDKAGFLGCYILDEGMICHRTRVALSLFCMPLRTWQLYLAGAYDDGDQYEAEVAQISLKLFQAFLHIVDEKLQQLSLLGCCHPGQMDMLRKRWEQIRLLVENAIIKLQL